MKDIEEILATAIEFERFGSEYYSRFEELVEDPKARALMKSLAKDEQEHASILEIELRNLGGKVKRPSKKELEKGIAELFPEKVHKHSLAAKDAIAAIKLGIRTEERSIRFYSRYGQHASPHLRKMFAKLEKMERLHKEMLEENLHHLENDGVWYGYVPILD